MKIFRMADVEKIEEMLAAGKTVEVEWEDGATGEMYTETVTSVRWDGVSIYHRKMYLHWN